MTARAVERLKERLDELRRVGWARLATAIVAALLAFPAYGPERGLSFGLAIGAFVLAVLAIRAFADRCDLIDAAVDDRHALTIPEVRRRAAEIASPAELAYVVDTLRRLASSSPRPRVLACRTELLELADALGAGPPETAAAVRCVRFVEGPASPLYRAGAEDDLRADLRHLLLLTRSRERNDAG
jgi:hypothetical protein